MYLVLVLIFAFSKVERDLIAHTPKKSLFPNCKWYVGNRWKTHSFWIKNVFTFLLDGWHFWESVNVLSASILFGLLMGQYWYWWALGAYVFTGLLMNIRSGSLFRKLWW